MLGRLLSTAASTLNPATYTSRNTTHLESVTEEEHTSGLLFPDASLLRRSNANAYPLQTTFNSPNASTAGAYDDRGGLELDPVKDFRVIIAQNALGDRDACVLLDTRASSSDQPRHGFGLDSQVPEPSGARHARTVSSLSRAPRRGHIAASNSSVAESSSFFHPAADARRSSPVSSGAFSRARGRSSTLTPSGGFHDSYHSRHSTDSNDSGLLNCIFGSSAFSYRGSSTKMHIISADDEPDKTGSSLTPRDVDMRGGAARSPLSRAYTTGSSSDLTISSDRSNDNKPPSKVTVLLTRMFSVNLPEVGDAPMDRHDSVASIYQGSLPPETAFPFPDVTKNKKIKEKKTPMYAVAITIQIPLLSRNAGRPSSRFSSQGADSPRLPMSCSLDSGERWRSGFFDDSMSQASPPASLDERIDLLVDHWDVITRTLSHLERLARKEILFLLKKVDALSGPHPKPAKAPKMQRTNQTIVHLPANILAVNSKLRDDALQTTRRISRALQTPYVVTGQSRWGVWREEGRSIVRNLGDKEHGFFFLVLITAFLGNHTEWLNSLGPDWHRRRHYLQQKAQQDSDPIISQRTVIISSDKMTARRLIFLLSVFLPAKQRFEPLPSPIRPGTAVSVRAVSQSPPSAPVLRQEELRRVIERRSRAQRLNLGDSEDHQRSVSVSSSETTHKLTDDGEQNIPAEFPVNRRGSDARSMKALNLPMHPKDVRAKKTSIGTVSTAMPSSAVPVPHFASRQSRSVRDCAVANGNESLASETLLRNLQRSESSAISNNSSIASGSGRWGSLFSGLWSTRQGSYTGRSDGTSPETRRRSVAAIQQSPRTKAPITLSQMVKEVSGPSSHADDALEQPASSDNISIPNAFAASRRVEDDLPESSPVATQVRESPLKLFVRGEDGVVDVDLPLPGFVSLSSSGDSIVASPKKTRTSVTSVDAMASTHSSSSAGFHCAQREYDGPNINVAGWLKDFHEDFLLQAVRPYTTLEAEIRRAMQAEATPSVPFVADSDGRGRWVDVATTLIADTRTFTIKRLRLKRRVPVGNGVRQNSPSPVGVSRPATPREVSGASTATQLSSFFSHATGSSKTSSNSTDGFDVNDVEEKFVEETVMDLDGTLVDAVERVLAQSGQSSLAQSRAPSPSRNRRAGEERNTSTSASRDEPPYLEVPRGKCRKMVLGALEEVVRSVTAEHCREDVDGGELGLADRERRRSLAGTDNTLREGVRRWLLDVEEAW